MKIYSAIVLAVGIVFGGAVNAQTNANKMMIDANKNLDAKRVCHGTLQICPGLQCLPDIQ